MKVSRSSIHRVVEACLELGVKKAEVYLAPDLVVRAARRFKIVKNEGATDIVLTIGRPNYAEREFIKLCKKSGEPFPIKKMQLKWYPKK